MSECYYKCQRLPVLSWWREGGGAESVLLCGPDKSFKVLYTVYRNVFFALNIVRLLKIVFLYLCRPQRRDNDTVAYQVATHLETARFAMGRGWVGYEPGTAELQSGALPRPLTGELREDDLYSLPFLNYLSVFFGHKNRNWPGLYTVFSM